MMRLVPDQSGAVRRTAAFEFTFDGQTVSAHLGDTIAVALLRAGVSTLRRAPIDGAPRGLFCCMGVCQECAVRVNGETVEGCRYAVREALNVQSLSGGMA